MLDNVSPYKVVIDRSTQAIAQRARYFRDLIVAVVIVFLGSIVAAIMTVSFKPFAMQGLILPICGMFFLVDGRLLARWRYDLLDSWKKRDIDLTNFCSAATSFPNLPKKTLLGMLSTLPVAKDALEERGIAACTRVALADVVTTIHACQTDLIASKVLMLSLIAIGVIFSVAMETWRPLVILMMLIPTVMGFRLVRKHRLRQLAIRLSRNQRPDFQLEIFRNQINRLNWGPISGREKKTFLQRMHLDGGGKVQQQQSQGRTSVNVCGKSSTESTRGDSSGCTREVRYGRVL